MIHILTRYASTPFGTFGEISVNGEKFYTIERPWIGNKGFVSCIPLGTYILDPHSSESHPKTYALVDNATGITHYSSPTARRYAILIHPGNTMDDFAGCIGIGMELGFVKGQWAVVNSRVATEKALSHMKPQDTLVIKEQHEGW